MDLPNFNKMKLKISHFVAFMVLSVAILCTVVGCDDFQLPKGTIIQHFDIVNNGDTTPVDVTVTSNGVDTICIGAAINQFSASHCQKVK